MVSSSSSNWLRLTCDALATVKCKFSASKGSSTLNLLFLHDTWLTQNTLHTDMIKYGLTVTLLLTLVHFKNWLRHHWRHYDWWKRWSRGRLHDERFRPWDWIYDSRGHLLWSEARVRKTRRLWNHLVRRPDPGTFGHTQVWFPWRCSRVSQVR